MNADLNHLLSLRIGHKHDENKSEFPYLIIGASYTEHNSIVFQVIDENGFPSLIWFLDGRYSPKTFQSLTHATVSC